MAVLPENSERSRAIAALRLAEAERDRARFERDAIFRALMDDRYPAVCPSCKARVAAVEGWLEELEELRQNRRRLEDLEAAYLGLRDLLADTLPHLPACSTVRERVEEALGG